jgi:hypothetical protein
MTCSDGAWNQSRISGNLLSFLRAGMVIGLTVAGGAKFLTGWTEGVSISRGLYFSIAAAEVGLAWLLCTQFHRRAAEMMLCGLICAGLMLFIRGDRQCGCLGSYWRLNREAQAVLVAFSGFWVIMYLFLEARLTTRKRPDLGGREVSRPSV